MSGLFITMEGGDGAGKSTQIENIKKYFEAGGYECICTREPGGTPVGEMLRNVLLDAANTDMDDVTEMMIFAASRSQHVRELIKPALAEGKVVICDRFKDSSVAYQGVGRGLGEIVEVVNDIAVDGLVPDITFWMDLDPETGRERVARLGEPDRLESEKLDFHSRVYEGYRGLQEKYPERIKRIDATKSIEEIKEDIYAELDKLTDR